MQRLESTSPLDPSPFLSDKRYIDVHICCKDGEIPAHRLFLAASCPLLKVAMRGVDSYVPEEKTCLCLPDFTMAQVGEFLQVVYGGKKEKISEAVALLLEMCCFQFIQGRRLPPMPVRDPSPPVLQRPSRKRQYEEEILDVDDYEPTAGDEAWKIPEGKKMNSEQVDVELGQLESNVFEEIDMDTGEASEQAQQQETKSVVMLSTCKLNVALPESNYTIQRDRETDLFMCPVMNCEYALTSKEFIISHVNNQHSKIQCMLCKVKIRPKDMMVHRARYHRPADKEADVDSFDWDKDKGRYECKVDGCLFVVKTQEELDRHTGAHTRVVCDYCGKAMTKEKLEKHKKFHTPTQLGRFECVECNNQFSIEQELDKHLSDYHHFVSNNIDSCVLCKRVKGSHLAIDVHSKRCVPIPQKKGNPVKKKSDGKTANIKVPIDPKRPNNCPHDGCDYENDRPSKVRFHYLQNHFRPLCPYCGESYSFNHLDRHIRTVHTKDLQHRCEECNLNFYKASMLEHHIDEVHIKELKFTCEECGDSFYSKNQLSRHKTLKHNISRYYPCNLCEKVYLNKYSLKKHRIRYHPGAPVHQWKPSRQGKKPKELVSQEDYQELGTKPKDPKNWDRQHQKYGCGRYIKATVAAAAIRREEEHELNAAPKERRKGVAAASSPPVSNVTSYGASQATAPAVVPQPQQPFVSALQGHPTAAAAAANLPFLQQQILSNAYLKHQQYNQM